VSRLSFIHLPIVALPSRALVILALVSFAAAGFGAETASPPPVPAKAEEINTPDTLRACLQLQEQLYATQLAIERNRNEADAAAAENAKAFATRIQGIEQALTLQRAQELDAMQSSNRAILFVAGLFAAFGLLAMLFIARFQWHSLNRPADMSAALPVAHKLGAGDAPVVTLGSVEQPHRRLLSALAQLEKRMYQMELTPNPPLNEGAPLAPAAPPPAPPSDAGTPAVARANAAAAPDAVHIAMLLGKGQSLLNLDQPEEALACFDQALALAPGHADVLLKRGAALERLDRLDEAIACYDQAIVADGSMTVAYLYKGGLLNRLERFAEALQCYEQALRSQEDPRS
jgi:tetratricopeptide (TPR) repeat protein